MSRTHRNANNCCCCLICRIMCPCIYKACYRLCQNTTSDGDNHVEITTPVGSETQRYSNSASSKTITTPLPSPPPKPSRVLVRALYDFERRQDDEVAFKKGDRMEVVQNTDTADWWTVKHLGTNEIGYVPSNYIAIDDNRPESQDWWFSVDRREADKQLLLPGNPKGTFMIRNSTDGKTFALSVRTFDETTRTVLVKHYRIRKNDNGVFIASNATFLDLLELVQHYRDSSDGLCCALTKACPKEPEPIPFKDFEVDRKDIQLSIKLGQGQFGEVWSGKLCRTVEVAVKTLKPGTMTALDFLNEAKAMHRLRHRKLVLLMGVCTKKEPYYIITELMVNGSLLDYLRKDKHNTLITFNVIVDFAAQVADGMAYLEAQKFIHRDLRAANILVGEHNVVKVADFGLARLVASDEGGNEQEIYTCNEHAKFPIKWTSPEAAFDRIFSTKSDVWSFGILLYEMITFGGTPYPGSDNSSTLIFIKDGGRMPRPTGGRMDCPMKFYEIMLHCWKGSPEERPTFEYLYGYFDSYGPATEDQYEES